MGVHHVDYTGTRVKNLSRRVEEVGVRLRKSEMSNNKLASLPDRAEPPCLCVLQCPLYRLYFDSICRNRGLRVHRPTVTTVTPRTYSTIYVIQPPSSLSAPIPPPAAHDRQDAASHTCRPRRYPGVLAQLERIPIGSYPSATPPALPGTVFLY